jgi:hypothetical protein
MAMGAVTNDLSTFLRPSFRQLVCDAERETRDYHVPGSLVKNAKSLKQHLRLGLEWSLCHQLRCDVPLR